MKGVPVEKYLELQKEFPNRFVYFFNVNGELNAEGKMATENLAMRNLLKRLEFVFYPEKELLHVTLTRISAPYDESEGNLNKIAGDIVAGCGIVPFPVRIVGA